jgi:hypothetical protein
MTLRDRLRRWWSPAQWDDDHPAERTQQEQPNKNALGRWFSRTSRLGEGDVGDLDPAARIDYERDFEKPR